MRTRRSMTIVIAGLILASCGGDGDAGDPAAPTSRAATVEPSALEGTWRSGEVTVEDLYAAGETLQLSRAEARTKFWGSVSELPLTFQVVIRDGRWFQTQVTEEGTEELGWEGTFEIVDDTTVVATDPCGSITYRYDLEGDALAVDMVEDECSGVGEDSQVGELLAQTLIYESTPFTRIG